MDLVQSQAMMRWFLRTLLSDNRNHQPYLGYDTIGLQPIERPPPTQKTLSKEVQPTIRAMSIPITLL